jgi:hypothetical protein
MASQYSILTHRISRKPTLAAAEPVAPFERQMSREFGKSVDWLLTGKTHTEPKKRAARDSAELE